MTLSDWLNVVQAGSVVVAAVVAARGINTWQREYIGKRRMELAEEVLAMFYEARDAIRDVRAPFSFGIEGTTRVAGINESPQRKDALDKAYVTVERLKRHQELFAKLFSARYRFMATFGESAGGPFYELNNRINELHNAAWAYGEYLMTPEGALMTEQHIDEYSQEFLRLGCLLFNVTGEDDVFDAKIVAIVDTVDQACRGVIESHGRKPPIVNTKPRKKDQ